jgi:hypothetical protein
MMADIAAASGDESTNRRSGAGADAGAGETDGDDLRMVMSAFGSCLTGSL